MPKSRCTAQAQQAILAAARSLFAQYGYAAVAIRAVARAADVSQGLIYHHFADKAALWSAVIANKQQEVQKILEQSDSYQSATCPWQRVRMAILFALKYIRSQPELIRLAKWAVLHDEHPVYTKLRHTPSQLLPDIEALQKAELIRTDRSAHFLTRYLMTNTAAWIERPLTPFADISAEDEDEAWLEMTLSALHPSQTLHRADAPVAPVGRAPEAHSTRHADPHVQVLGTVHSDALVQRDPHTDRAPTGVRTN